MNLAIINNFKVYNHFLSKQTKRGKEISTSLKMMYSIHMENTNVNKFFLLKQITRFIVKLMLLPFYKVTIVRESVNQRCVMLKNSYIEEYVTKQSKIELIDLKLGIAINTKLFIIVRELISVILILFREPNLNKKYILVLMHRLIDYLNAYHHTSLQNTDTVFVENDRTPINLGFIHKAREKNIKTVKYDNWLIDKINHNDIYCEYYFYPSLYHKNIIQSFNQNQKLKYVEGGFLYWDRLSLYQNSEKNKTILYFTQFGIPIDTHKKHLEDIVEIMHDIDMKYKIIVKVHPRENKSIYENLLETSDIIKILAKSDDIYRLIGEADFCFSVFSTISLEAKHIIENSYFINYNSAKFEIVDYNALGLDVARNKYTLRKILKGEYVPIMQNKFIKDANCKYPHSLESLRGNFCHD